MAHKCTVWCLQMAGGEPREPHVISNLSGMRQARYAGVRQPGMSVGGGKMVGIAAGGIGDEPRRKRALLRAHWGLETMH